MSRTGSSSLRIAVLSGGDSAERDVSLASGAAVCEALRAAGHEALPFDPARIPVAHIPWFTFDACFLALHGGAGEDGRVQAELEALGVDFTSSPAEACRVAMNKSAAKERLALAGVASAPYCLLHGADSDETAAAKAAALGYPLVVKPNSQGSSLGVCIVRDPAQLAAALAAARQLDPFTILEQYVVGREMTVAVLDRRALPALEIETPRGWFDYEAKYLAVDTREEFPDDLPPRTVALVEQTAVRAADAIGARGLSRVDLILDAEGIPWVLELNTIPGMTQTSLAPKAARLAGFDMPALCKWMVQDAIHRGRLVRQRALVRQLSTASIARTSSGERRAEAA